MKHGAYEPPHPRPKVPEYALHVGPLADFVQSVNRLIADGWKPLGGPCVGTDGRLVQAMTKGL